MLYIPVSQVGPEKPAGHAVHIFSSWKTQAVHVPLHAGKVKQVILTELIILKLYMPVAHVGPENPSGHAVHIFSSVTSHAVHVPPQAECRYRKQNYKCIHIC